MKTLQLALFVALVLCGIFFAVAASRLAQAIRKKAPEEVAAANALDRLAFSGAEPESQASPAIGFLLSRRYRHLGLGRDAFWGSISFVLLVCAFLLCITLAITIGVPNG